MSELKACPFCAKPLRVSPNKINPSARCATEDCIGGRMPVINLDDPIMVAAWNTRPPSQPGREAELLAFIKQLSDALLSVRPLGGSELFVNRFGNYYADPKFCADAIKQMSADLHEARIAVVRAQRASLSRNSTDE